MRYIKNICVIDINMAVLYRMIDDGIIGFDDEDVMDDYMYNNISIRNSSDNAIDKILFDVVVLHDHQEFVIAHISKIRNGLGLEIELDNKSVNNYKYQLVNLN